VLALALLPRVASADPEAPRESWFRRIRYGVGFAMQAGGGTDTTTFGPHLALEPAAFELRSFLAERFAFHTTLNVGRMVAAGVLQHDGRIDYDCHLGGHVPVAVDRTLVVAPGASIAYSFTKSGYQRFVGDVRLGLDLHDGRFTTGVYVRPYVGWNRDVGAEHGRVVGGALLEIVGIYMVPKKGERAGR
jgi:hypothetical protein